MTNHPRQSSGPRPPKRRSVASHREGHEPRWTGPRRPAAGRSAGPIRPIHQRVEAPGIAHRTRRLGTTMTSENTCSTTAFFCNGVQQRCPDRAATAKSTNNGGSMQRNCQHRQPSMNTSTLTVCGGTLPPACAGRSSATRSDRLPNLEQRRPGEAARPCRQQQFELVEDNRDGLGGNPAFRFRTLFKGRPGHDWQSGRSSRWATGSRVNPAAKSQRPRPGRFGAARSPDSMRRTNRMVAKNVRKRRVSNRVESNRPMGKVRARRTRDCRQ